MVSLGCSQKYWPCWEKFDNTVVKRYLVLSVVAGDSPLGAGPPPTAPSTPAHRSLSDRQARQLQIGKKTSLRKIHDLGVLTPCSFGSSRRPVVNAGGKVSHLAS